MLNIQIYKHFFSTTNKSPEKKKLIILGSGWGGYNLAKNTDAKKYEITLVSPRNHFLFTPLLPSTCVGTLEPMCVQENVRALKGVRFLQAKTEKFDFEKKKLLLENVYQKGERFSIDYDKLVIAVGAETQYFDLPGIDENLWKSVFFLKQLSHSRKIRLKIIEQFERAEMPHFSSEEKKAMLHFVVVGGGPNSCEFTAEFYDFLKKDMPRLYPDLKDHVKITMVEAAEDILGTFNQNLRKYVEKLFKKRHINLKTEVAFEKIAEEKFDGFREPQPVGYLNNGEKMKFGMMIWSAGVRPIKLIRDNEQLSKNKQGRIDINGQLQVKLNGKQGFEQDVFAIGDCATNKDKSLPQIAQVASQQARYLSKYFNNDCKSANDFEFFNLGQMAFIGNKSGVIDATSIGNPYGKKHKITYLEGFSAFLIWRAAYWGKQVSWSNKILIPMHWLKSSIFGRDTSSY
ncbi:hypothetical protein PPERSA_09537 [Pseudocohnilembus persalinus]|uniref:Uncharacterized protein n=1 Tax=Pseudocohnilembus persalinus TaxID=266149 RepID=A0A0V0QFE7_PSEPJ|nr:hypothetical protein PPERSA_09537 [Pseudocohnilembus persalinus]|eukprot:KRX00931.1 hypothetical protein PPERSA_09537 [Pseudocohnilembus persalinus]